MAMEQIQFDVIIAGGSYAGISAALALGRSLREVLIIDSGSPCNLGTPFSHNLITHDGTPPEEIMAKARKELETYTNVRLLENTLAKVDKDAEGFIAEVITGEQFSCKKLLFATGVRDTLPGIRGFYECWGTSAFHCPYCHGYEHRNNKVIVLAGGDHGFEFTKTLRNWFDDLTLCTNGMPPLSKGQQALLRKHGIEIVEKRISHIAHTEGQARELVFTDGSTQPVEVFFAAPDLTQHCDIPAALGCELTKEGLLVVNEFQQTTLDGIYAAGDNSRATRAISVAIGAGAIAGMCINQQLTSDAFGD